MRSNKGASVVEFALIAPLLFLLLFGVIEFGRIIITYTGVFTAAREGARYGTTVGDNDDGIPRYADCDGIRTAARAKTPLVTLTDGDIQIWYDNGEDCSGDTASGPIARGDRVIVEVSTTFRSPIPLISNLVGNLTISSEQKRSVYPESG